MVLTGQGMIRKRLNWDTFTQLSVLSRMPCRVPRKATVARAPRWLQRFGATRGERERPLAIELRPHPHANNRRGKCVIVILRLVRGNMCLQVLHP